MGQSAAWLTFITAHATAFASVLAATGLAYLFVFGVFVVRGGVSGARAWINKNADDVRGELTRRIVVVGHELYSKQATLARKKSGETPDSEIEAIAVKWLHAVSNWLRYENRRRTRIFLVRYAPVLLLGHSAASGCAWLLHTFGETAGWFAGAVVVAVLTGVGFGVMAVPLGVDLWQHGAPAERK